MPNKDDNKKLISVIEENSSDWLEQVPAVLGDLSGNVSAGGSLVYARLDNGYPIIAVNYIAPLIFDLHVLVGRNKSQSGFFQVISVREAYIDPQSEFIKYHHEQHEYDDVSPGPDVAWIRRKQLLPFTVLVKDPAGFIVQVFGSVFLGASGFAIVDNQEVDLSSYVPTSGALFVVIETNDSGVLSINEGDGFGSPELSAIDNIPTPAVGKYPLAAVLLFESQPELLNSNILVLFPMSSNPGNFQPLDADLTAIAGLTPTDDDIIQRKSGAWTNRTLAQLITDITEAIQDLIGAMVSGNTETGINVTYDDTNGKLDFVVTVSGSHSIEDEGTPLTARSKLNFVGGGITATDDSGDDASVITVNEQTIGDLIEGSTNKATPIDADRFGFWDSVADILKHATWANIKSTLQTVFDAIYAPIAKGVTNGDSHDHIGGDGGTVAYSSISGTPTIREVLAAARTYYVRTDGSDSNNGLTDSAGGAFLTIQKALDTILTIDFNNKTVTIQVRDATWTTGGTLAAGWTGGGSLVIQGNSGTPANALISVTSADCFLITGNLPGTLTIKDFELRTTTSGNCINHQGTGIVRWNNIRFGACAVAHIWSGSNAAVVECAGNYAITGNATVHFFATQGGLIRAATYTATVSASLTFTYFAWSENDSVIYCYPNLVFSTTTATGTRYLVTTNAVINVAGAGANYFPGNAAGSTSTGGQYV